MEILFNDLSFLVNRDLLCVGPFDVSRKWAVFGNDSCRKLTNAATAQQQDIWPVKIGIGESLEEVMIWSDLEQFKVVDVMSPDTWKCSDDYKRYINSQIMRIERLYTAYGAFC